MIIKKKFKLQLDYFILFLRYKDLKFLQHNKYLNTCKNEILRLLSTNWISRHLNKYPLHITKLQSTTTFYPP